MGAVRREMRKVNADTRARGLHPHRCISITLPSAPLIDSGVEKCSKVERLDLTYVGLRLGASFGRSEVKAVPYSSRFDQASGTAYRAIREREGLLSPFHQ